MKRREFVTLIGGAAVWPIAARAQRSGAMRHIAVVGALAPDDVEIVKRSAAFEQALAALGWTKGGTIAIDYHWIANDSALAQKTAVEVVALAPDVLLASSNIVIEQLSKATGTIPIVMVQVVDPVGSGYVEGMARPGGNITGFTQFEYSLAGKWLDLLLEIAPGTTRVAVRPSLPHAEQDRVAHHSGLDRSTSGMGIDHQSKHSEGTWSYGASRPARQRRRSD
jgi:ABC-type uncharacterized transport system substrate-binding protein